MAYKSIRAVKKRSIVDDGTGELLGVSQIDEHFYIKGEEEPPYIKMYLRDIAKLNGLSRGVYNVLLELIGHIDYSNEILLPVQVKIRICKRLGIYSMNKDTGEYKVGLNILDQYLKKLADKKIIYRKGRGVYLADPKIFGKGSWKNIQGIIMTVSYGFDESGNRTDRLVNVELNKNKTS